MKDFNCSRTIVGEDGSSITFGVSGCHSHDEAVAIVDKSVYDYELKCEKEAGEHPAEGEEERASDEGMAGGEGVRGRGRADAGKV